MKKIVSIIILFFYIPLMGKLSDFNIKKIRSEDFFKKGYIYFSYRKYTIAADYFIKSITEYSKNYKARDLLGRAYYLSGRVDNALIEWKNMIEIGGGDNLLRQRVNCYLYRIGKENRFVMEKEYIKNNYIDGAAVSDIMFLNPTDILADANGNLFIVAFSSDAIIKITSEGKAVKRITSAQKKFKKPYGIAQLNPNMLIITEFGNDRVQIITPDGKGIKIFGESGIAQGQFYGPEGVAVDKRGNIYIADTGNYRIEKFNSQGKFLAQFGKEGNKDEPGRFVSISGLDIDKDDNIWVSDSLKGAILIFDSAGNFIKEIGEDFLTAPRDINYLSEKEVLISDSLLGLLKFNTINYTWQNLISEQGIFSADIDYNKVLYFVNFETSKMETYIPKKLKYVNLDLFIENIDVNSYPYIGCYFTVKTREGEFIRNITEDNLLVNDNDLDIFPFNVSQPQKVYEPVKAVILVENSAIMTGFKKNIATALDLYLQNIDLKNDENELLLYSEDVENTVPFTKSRLKILQALDKPAKGIVKDLGKFIYFGITELIGTKGYHSLILITSGIIGYKDFFTFNLDTVINYAINNHIPVDVISFEQDKKSIPQFKELAISTGGIYYSAYEPDKIKNHYSIIKSRKKEQYLLIYETHHRKYSEGTWSKLQITVKYQEMIGKDILGYYVPE